MPAVMPKTIELKTEGFLLVLELVSRSAGGQYSDWLHCNLHASLHGFSANYSFKLSTDELVRFHNGLLRMQRDLGKEIHSADMTDRSGPDEYFNLTMELNKLGQIEGRIILSNVPLRVSLEGSFSGDQTLLGPLSEQIKDVFREYKI
jgi:hypothetical protein